MLKDLGLLDYMEIIGFKPPGKDNSITANLISPVIFFITSNIIKDTFFNKMRDFEK